MNIIRAIIYGFFYPILATGVVLYLIQSLTKPAESPSFELAVISAVIGGFALSGGFLQQASSNLQRSIKRIGVLYLGASIAFVAFTLITPMLSTVQSGTCAYWIVFPAGVISMFAAMAFFSVASGLLISELPRLIQEFF